MRRSTAALAAIAAAGIAGCGREDPCDFGASGARWMALGSAESGAWQVHLVRADGSCRRPVTSAPAPSLHPSWGKGARIAYESDRAPGLGVWTQDVVSGAERRLDLGDLLAASPAFSPDGTKIAFAAHLASTTAGTIYVVPAEGGTPTMVTPEVQPFGNGGPAFSPDGATIYFVSNRAGPYEIFQVPAAGGAVAQVTTGSRIVGKPAASPDGKLLAFARAVGTSTEVVLYALGSGTTTPLGVPDASEPTFDPGGGRLAIRVPRGSSSNVELVLLDGSGPLAVTTGSGPDGAPAFAP